MKNPYNINYSEVISSAQAWNINKQLATRLSMSDDVIKVSDVLALVDDSMYTILSQELNENDSAELFLLTILTAVAEDTTLYPINSEEIEMMFDRMSFLLTLEYMSRSGAIELHKDQLTLDLGTDPRTFFTATDESLKTFLEASNAM